MYMIINTPIKLIAFIRHQREASVSIDSDIKLRSKTNLCIKYLFDIVSRLAAQMSSVFRSRSGGSTGLVWSNVFQWSLF